MNPGLVRMLRDSTGWDLSRSGPGAVERAVRRRVEAQGARSLDDYLARLGGSREELQALIEELAVCESWFYRYPESFRSLAAAIQNAPPTALEILCLACSTGEEAYSIAIQLLHSGLGPERFRVHAVDISLRALDVCRRGFYRQFSFRGAPGFLMGYFERVPDGWRVQERVRRQVEFCQANALEFVSDRKYRAVFCRNLVIYLEGSSRVRLWRQIYSLLEERGLLFVGPSETSEVSPRLFTPLPARGTYALRKGRQPDRLFEDSPGAREFRSTPPARAPCEAPRSGPPPPWWTEGRRSGAFHPGGAAVAARGEAHPSPSESPPRDRTEGWRLKLPPAVGTEVIAPLPAPREDLLEKARRLADRGEIHEALELCLARMRERGPSAEVHFLAGLLLDSMASEEEAASHYRKAAYLDPGHAPALLQLGLWAERRGDTGAAANFRRRARRAGGEP